MRTAVFERGRSAQYDLEHRDRDLTKRAREDALIDNPTRERGQWIGDVGIVGMEIGGCRFLRISVSCAAAWCSRPSAPIRKAWWPDRVPAGSLTWLPYARQWVPACLELLAVDRRPHGVSTNCSPRPKRTSPHSIRT